jgi:pyrroloquinoline quinone biosynthesis protein D
MGVPIPGHAQPKLARKARLRFDRHTGKHWLLYPERGMLLSPSAAAIAALCTGVKTLAQIIDELHAGSAVTSRTSNTSREQIAQDVQQFLCALRDRGLLDPV